MNAGRGLKSRIRGWFPRELLGFSFEDNILYSEWVSAGKFVKAFVGSVSVTALFVLAMAVWFSISMRSPLFAVIVAFPLIFLLILFGNYRGVRIRITSKELIVTYGIFNRKRILISEIASCEHTRASFGKYWGVGVRYGTDGSLAYSTSFSNAVKINRLRERPFVFSSNKPDEICSIISRMNQQK
jgi:hypothetical protein